MGCPVVFYDSKAVFFFTEQVAFQKKSQRYQNKTFYSQIVDSAEEL